MNRRIKKKVAKRQLIKAMQGLVDLAQEWERREEERTRRLVVAFEKSYQQRASVQESGKGGLTYQNRKHRLHGTRPYLWELGGRKPQTFTTEYRTRSFQIRAAQHSRLS